MDDELLSNLILETWNTVKSFIKKSELSTASKAFLQSIEAVVPVGMLGELSIDDNYDEYLRQAFHFCGYDLFNHKNNSCDDSGDEEYVEDVDYDDGGDYDNDIYCDLWI